MSRLLFTAVSRSWDPSRRPRARRRSARRRDDREAWSRPESCPARVPDGEGARRDAAVAPSVSSRVGARLAAARAVVLGMPRRRTHTTWSQAALGRPSTPGRRGRPRAARPSRPVREESPRRRKSTGPRSRLTRRPAATSSRAARSAWGRRVLRTARQCCSTARTRSTRAAPGPERHLGVENRRCALCRKTAYAKHVTVAAATGGRARGPHGRRAGASWRAPIRPARPSTAPAAAKLGVSVLARTCAPTTTSSWARATTRSTRCSPSPTTRWRRRARCWRRPAPPPRRAASEEPEGRPTPSGRRRRARPRRRAEDGGSAPCARAPPGLDAPALLARVPRGLRSLMAASGRAIPARRRVRRPARGPYSEQRSSSGLLSRLCFVTNTRF